MRVCGFCGGKVRHESKHESFCKYCQMETEVFETTEISTELIDDCLDGIYYFNQLPLKKKIDFIMDSNGTKEEKSIKIYHYVQFHFDIIELLLWRNKYV